MPLWPAVQSRGLQESGDIWSPRPGQFTGLRWPSGPSHGISSMPEFEFRIDRLGNWHRH